MIVINFGCLAAQTNPILTNRLDSSEDMVKPSLVLRRLVFQMLVLFIRSRWLGAQVKTLKPVTWVKIWCAASSEKSATEGAWGYIHVSTHPNAVTYVSSGVRFFHKVLSLATGCKGRVKWWCHINSSMRCRCHNQSVVELQPGVHFGSRIPCILRFFENWLSARLAPHDMAPCRAQHMPKMDPKWIRPR